MSLRRPPKPYSAVGDPDMFVVGVEAGLLGGDPLHAAPQVVQGARREDGADLQAVVGQQLPRGPELVEGKLPQLEAVLALVRDQRLG